jgi:MFS family permease
MIRSTSAYLHGAIGGLPRDFWYLWLGTLINRLGIFVTPFLTLFLTSQRGLSVVQATQIIALEGAGSFVSHLVGGGLTDRFGRRITMLISFFITPVLMILLYLSSDFGVIALLVFAYGFFIDLYRPASSAMIADIVPPEHRLRAYSLRYWAINLGAAVALSLAGFLATANYAYLFIGDAITTFIFGLVVLFLIKESRPDSTAKPAVSQTIRLRHVVPPQERPIFAFVLIFVLFSICFGMIMFQSNTVLSLDMKAKGLSEADYGLASAVNGIVIVLVSLPLNQYLTRYSRFVVMAIAVLCGGIGFGMNALAFTLPAFAFAVVVWTMGELIANPVATTIIADVSPVERRGFYQGMYGSSWGLAAALGPLLGGEIYQRWNGEGVWYACLILSVVVALCFLFIVRPWYARLMRTMPATSV